MTTQAPRIAIPEPTADDHEYNQRSLPQYLHAIQAAGGEAVPIDLHQPGHLQAQVLATCSGILLPGSPADMDPQRYGQQPVEACAARDLAREAADNLLLRDAFAQGKPLLGICFGLQSLNVYCHGTLIQDLPPANGASASAVNHEPGRTVLDAHPVVVMEGTRFAQIASLAREGGVSPADLLVNSSHHQAVDTVGDKLQVAAKSPQDGVVEALETTDPGKFVVAVQWHPERSYEQSAVSRALFAAFIDAARKWHGQLHGDAA